jgi:oxygen-independent coproporphyrinogen-3 oxidase
LETAERQRPFFALWRGNPSRAALYIAIPFCPSRCVYCSFPATVLTARVRPSYDAYLRELAAEIERAGAALRARGLVCDSVYLGGGTPAILSAAETEFILAALTRAVPLAPDGELTFEAGRPELVTAEKLRVLAAGGVNRLSINPQTMNDATLVRIGRPHTAADTGAAFALARAEGDWRINMDLIRGLPGETDETLAASLNRVLALRPDNVTLHALARKRGAALAQTPPPERAEEADVYAPLRAAGYLPYYLYRQKNSTAGGENTGWALPGAESRYNIAMMEEALMVWGLGAGAASKLPAGGGRHDNVFEPADLGMYLRRDRRDWRKAGLPSAAEPAEDT